MDENLPLDEEVLVHYMDGTLSQEETTSLEARLNNDPVLFKQLERLKTTRLAVQYAGTAQQVRTMHKEMMLEIKNPANTGRVMGMSRKFFYMMGTAASIILVFFVLRLFYPSAAGADEIYQQAFVDYTLSASRGGEDHTKIAILYEQQNYSSVLSKDSLAKDQQDSLLVGMSALKLSYTKKAIEWFGHISPGNNYYPDAQFYLALGYLKDKQYAAAREIMHAIAKDPDHIYHQRISPDLIRRVEALEQ